VHDDRARVRRALERCQQPVGADGEAVSLVRADEVVRRVRGVEGEWVWRVVGGGDGDEREALLVVGGDEGLDFGEGGLDAADRVCFELVIVSRESVSRRNGAHHVGKVRVAARAEGEVLFGGAVAEEPA
jgi:hypothetical protein